MSSLLLANYILEILAAQGASGDQALHFLWQVRIGRQRE
jgi:hypothetical protein